jgi:hypothetical protein
MSPVKIKGTPLTKTVLALAWVRALQWVGGQPFLPQQGWALTLAPCTATVRPLINTEASPLTMTPPALF